MSQKARNVFLCGSGSIIALVVVFLFTLTVGLAGASSQQSVESIYQSIRHAAPVYQVQEEIVTFQNEGMNLVATLVRPKGLNRPPVVITLNGFAEDRFYKEIPNTGGEHYYPRLSRLFAEHGIATLRVDYRGSGDSDGEYTMTTFSSQISDAHAAVDFIRKNLGHLVNKNAIGMFGHSQGGLVTSVTASKNKKISSIGIWSAVVTPPFSYGSLISFEGIRQGAVLPVGGTITLPIILGGIFLGDIELGQGFFQDLFSVDARAAIKDYHGPLMYVAGKNDPIVFPQPLVAQSLLDNHDGEEKLVLLPGDHEFDSDYDYPQFDDAVFWVAAWFTKTLK